MQSCTHMQTFLYLAFGNQAFFDEVQFSIFSLKTVTPNVRWRIAVYTDRPEFYSRLPDVEPISISREKVQAWIASFGYFFRVKIQALRDCMDRFGGNVTMLDGDTFFVNNPADTLKKHAANRLDERPGPRQAQHPSMQARDRSISEPLRRTGYSKCASYMAHMEFRRSRTSRKAPDIYRPDSMC